MCYSHSSAWLISRCPILAWLPSAQLIFLHCKSAFPRAEFSSIHDVLNPVSRAQHFTRQSRLAQRSPRSARAGQGAGAWRSRAHAVLQSLGWLLTFAIGYFGSDHFGSSPLTLSQDNPPVLCPFCFCSCSSLHRQEQAATCPRRSQDISSRSPTFATYAVLASPSEIIVSLGLTLWVPEPPESLLLHCKYIHLI